MLRRSLLAGLAGFALLAACDFKPKKAEILKKAEGIRSRAELEKALGQPDELDKAGPMQRWTYKASDGSVTFMIVGDRVVVDMTGK